MAWPNPFIPDDENTRHCWGYKFQWSPLHFTPEELEPLKYTCDTLADECLPILDSINDASESSENLGGEKKSEEDGRGKGDEKRKKKNLYELLKGNHMKDEKLGRLWREVNTVPDWVDWEVIGRGQDVFYRYAGVALTSVSFFSLPTLSGSSVKVVMWKMVEKKGGLRLINGDFSWLIKVYLVGWVLVELRKSSQEQAGSQYPTLKNEASPSYPPPTPHILLTRFEVYETTQHILQITSSLPSIQPGGAGHISTLRVRLLHAYVRRRILKLASTRPTYYSVPDHGIPINDLDSVGTIATFSSTLIWLGIPRQLIWLRPQEISDYIALWRLVAYYLGVPTEYFETPEKAKAIMESILISEMNPSETSKVLANNIIESLQGKAPAYASRGFLEASARWLNGNELGDALGIGRPGWYYWALVAGQVGFFWGWCWVKRGLRWVDRERGVAIRNLLYKSFILNETHGLGKETDFSFQYIPSYDLTTVGPNEREKSGVVVKGVERRNLLTFLSGCVLVGSVFLGFIKGVQVVRAL
ncbi:hypothetical protein HYALB_00007793 [Hymenoscyphus albidus]|uniref:ER-bound oxygenase mpaB/mpaB'/Rubber oxygenase catalytic domain-containing protein n=1 Tax=Hymenoscyphus albidus TaxID=595503 RepID=A0A9N9PR03_9HELO|nr:hypothetical protein HYALB_00007793 [Hymenoscyphus albidus]